MLSLRYAVRREKTRRRCNAPSAKLKLGELKIVPSRSSRNSLAGWRLDWAVDAGDFSCCRHGSQPNNAALAKLLWNFRVCIRRGVITMARFFWRGGQAAEKTGLNLPGIH
jgi:hypothetical protein